MVVLILLCIFLCLLAIGVPIVFSLGITSVVMLLGFSNIPLAIVPEVMFNSLNSFTLMAIPFFVIAAHFMLKGGVAKYLYQMANAYIGSVHGGLAIAAVISCMIFGAICGSSVATALTMGVIVVPFMVQYGYTKESAIGCVAASGSLGIIIPPSIPLILYGILAEESIPRLFIAGIAAGLFQVIMYIIYIYFSSKKKGFKGAEKVSRQEIIRSTIKALPALTLPVMVLYSIYSGICTVTEAAVLSVFLAMIVSIFIYKEVKISEIIPITGEAMKSAAMIMIIISTALLLGTWLTQEGLSSQLANYVKENHFASWQFLLLLNGILLVLGMFLEVVSIMYIVLPVVIPLLGPLGIDPVHFAIVVVVNMEIALISPPVGLNLYVLSNATKTPVSTVIKGAWPYVVIGLIELVVITYWPSFTLYLPNLLMPK